MNDEASNIVPAQMSANTEEEFFSNACSAQKANVI